jgi:hypothetical protein
MEHMEVEMPLLRQRREELQTKTGDFHKSFCFSLVPSADNLFEGQNWLIAVLCLLSGPSD